MKYIFLLSLSFISLSSFNLLKKTSGSIYKLSFISKKYFSYSSSNNEIARILKFYNVNYENSLNILKLNYNFTEEELQKAYSSLAKIIHPDKNLGIDNADEAFKILNNANDLLKNSKTKNLSENCQKNNNYYQKVNTVETLEQEFTEYDRKHYATIKKIQKIIDDIDATIKNQNKVIDDIDSTINDINKIINNIKKK